MNRLQEIQRRLNEIQADIEQRGDTISAQELDAYEEETQALIEERKSLTDAAEKRAALLQSIAQGTAGGAVVRSFPTPGQPGKEQRADVADQYDTVEYRKAFMNYVLRGTPIPIEYRDDEVTKTTDAGAVIPTTVLDKIIEKMENVGMVLPLVTQTSYRGGVAIPTSTVKPVATWVNEGAGSVKQKLSSTTEGRIVFGYNKLRCAVAVTLETDTMALGAFEAMLMKNIPNAMVKALEQAIFSGDGNGKPKGFLTETPATGHAIQSAAPAYKDLLDAEAALPEEYENGAVWFMTKKTFMAYYGLLDSEGQPIGRVNYGIEGKPERFLLGRPVITVPYMDSYASNLATGKVFACLFRPEDYTVNTNYQMTIKKYEDNDTDDQVTKAIMLVDGKATDINSLVVIKKKAA